MMQRAHAFVPLILQSYHESFAKFSLSFSDLTYINSANAVSK